MKEAPGRQVRLVAVLAAIDAVLVALAVVLAVHLHGLFTNLSVTVALAVISLLLETLVIDLPVVGFATLTASSVFALCVLQGPPVALLTAALCTSSREVTRGRGGLVSRLLSASLSFLPLASACLAYFFVSGQASPRTLLAPSQWLAVAVATAVFSAVDLGATLASVLSLIHI